MNNSSEKVKNKKKSTIIPKEENDVNETSLIKSKSEKEQNKQISILINRIRFLERLLQKYEDVVPFDLNSKLSEKEIELEMNDEDKEQDHFHR